MAYKDYKNGKVLFNNCSMNKVVQDLKNNKLDDVNAGALRGDVVLCSKEGNARIEEFIKVLGKDKESNFKMDQCKFEDLAKKANITPEALAGIIDTCKK